MKKPYIERCLTLTKKHSFFLFGPRNTGKSTLLSHIFSEDETHFFDLLNFQDQMRFARNPDELYEIVNLLPIEKKYIVIDEIQKVPTLLDVVQRLMKTSERYFILTGSSARKLKQGGANLLAGRAFVYHLYPYSFIELKTRFNLQHALHWGMLPELFLLDDNQDKEKFLYAYAHTYLKEEIWEEQFIKDLAPFRHFLEVAAQCNGKIINYENIARDVGIDNKTVQRYYSILEDTLIGFFLPAFQHSFRKKLNSKPKFYFFDTGVTRCLNRMISVPLIESTMAYGDAFEHFVILEIIKLSSYYHQDYRLSYLRTNDDAEIDLIVERPGQKILFIEIKSTDHIKSQHVSTLKRLAEDFGECEAVCLSRDPYPHQFDNIAAYQWREGIEKFFSANFASNHAEMGEKEK